MSDRRRKYTENSVVASIDQIQAMLAEDRRPARPSKPVRPQSSIAPADAPPPPSASEQAAPVALPVSSVSDLTVPSWEEVQSNREARWSNESQDAVVVPAMSSWRRWRRRLAFGLVAAALIGGTVGVMWLMRPEVAETQPFALPYVEAIHAAEQGALTQTSQARIDALQAQVDQLTTEKASLEQSLDASKKAAADAADAAVIAATVSKTEVKPKKTRRRVKRRRTKSGTTRKRRVRRRRSTKTDKSLEGLLNTL